MSTFEPTQFVLIDDSDPRIQYEGDWGPEVQGATDGWGIYGPAHNRTLTRITSDGSFTFKFNGTGIGMEGSIDTLDGRPRPSWTCFIDNKSTRNQQADDNNRSNHWPICDTNDLVAGEHTFTLRVTVPPRGAFWFDRLSIAPLGPVSAGETMYISNDDSSVSYSPLNNFNRSGDIVHLTDIADSSVTLKFTGSSASLFSVYEPNRPEGKGHYSIDGQPPVSFTIPGHKDVNARFNQELFRISDLPPTEHTLVATFDGQRGDTPLSVDYFHVTLPPKNTTENGNTPGPTQSQSPDTNTQNSTPIGAIVGGVVGGVAFLVLVALGIFFLRRRNQRRMAEPTPFEPKSFVSAPMNRASYQLAPQSEADLLSSEGSSYDPYATHSVVQPSDALTAIRKQQRELEAWNQAEREVDVVHVDSGIRLGTPDAAGPSGSRIVRDIPPQYTEH